MKSSYPLLFILVLLSLPACHKSDVKPATIDCETLNNGFLDRNEKIVGPIIDDLVQDLPPNPLAGDGLGHAKNLEKLVDRLNTACDDYTASVICYACIETLPAQSEILIELDSLGSAVERVMDISTPEGDLLKLVRFH